MTRTSSAEQATRIRRSWTPDTVALVPTMGALHDGHMALVREAAARCRRVVVSIFVNPIQFGPGEDYLRYPRDPEGDAARLEEAGVDLLFEPGVTDMYPGGFSTSVDVGGLGGILCGLHRPGHFRGVATVCAALFGIVEPDVAVFGMKDAQQLAVVSRMTADLRLRPEIAAVPTVREPDGLAMSSRNLLLSAEERAAAPLIRKGLLAAADLARRGERRAGALRRRFVETVSQSELLRVQYAELVDADFRPVEELAGPGMMLAAVFAGSTRLIDNMPLLPGAGVPEG